MKKSEARREGIIQAAFTLFFEKGYDATTMRMIMNEVGCEAGLFYYYYESKDALFEEVLNRFFENYKKDFAVLVEKAKRDPYRALNTFFLYMVEETDKFRRKYAGNIHRTIRWSIREETLSVIVPYIREILEILEAFGAHLQLDKDVLAMFMAHGVGSFIVHEDISEFAHAEPQVKKGLHLMMGLGADTADIMFPHDAELSDVPYITRMVSGQARCFPGFNETDFIKDIAEKIEKKEVLVIRHKGKAVGCAIFSREGQTIDLLITENGFTRKGIATRLLVTAMSQFSVDSQCFVTALCDNDPLGKEALSLLHRFGFSHVEEVTVAGTPCQKMAATVPDGAQIAKIAVHKG